jgi:hypothetical protein
MAKTGHKSLPSVQRHVKPGLAYSGPPHKTAGRCIAQTEFGRPPVAFLGGPPAAELTQYTDPPHSDHDGP